MEAAVIFIKIKSRNINFVGTRLIFHRYVLGLYFLLKEVDKCSLHISDRVNLNKRSNMCLTA